MDKEQSGHWDWRNNPQRENCQIRKNKNSKEGWGRDSVKNEETGKCAKGI